MKRHPFQGSSTDGLSAGCDFPQHHQLFPASQEIVDPLKAGELCEFIVQDFWDDCV